MSAEHTHAWSHHRYIHRSPCISVTLSTPPFFVTRNRTAIPARLLSEKSRSTKYFSLRHDINNNDSPTASPNTSTTTFVCCN